MKQLFLIIAALSCLFVTNASGPKVLFIGDSITDGNWGGGGAKPSDERNHWDQNHIFGSGYMYLCAAHFQGEMPSREFEFFNRGISGNTLSDLEKRWQQDVIDISPDVLSVLVGTNDVHYYLDSKSTEPFDFSAWEKRYRGVLNRTKAACKDVKIVLCTPFVAPTGSMKDSERFALRDSLVRHCASIVRKLAEDYDATLVEYDTLFDEILRSQPTSKDTYWIWDGIHPTAAGHQRMADLWINKTSGLLD